ncbi:hypothetical protein [Streptomyces sp. NBC_01716]|uniref:hypothetical protein n=1 Tax=Streptomyces sp. NBC_01716 TaxID=2975917 RepID=UPI002E342A32|nr:hypothetical protein [Streptomyces sp. NBC_01716]
MPKTEYKRTRKDAQKASRELKKGDVVYIVYDIANDRIPYEDAQLYSALRITGDHPLLGGAMIGGQSVESLVLNYGPVYTQPPKGIRNVATPGAQVGGPLPDGYEGVLDEAEIRGLEKQVADGSDPRKRRSLRGWRI